jgi:hypothetical protein
MSCVKVSSRLSLRWWSCRRRSCQRVPRTLRQRPRRRQLKLRPLPPSRLPRWRSFPGRPSRPVRWCGGAAIGAVVGARSVGRWGVCTGADLGGEAIMVAHIGAAGIIGAGTAVMGSITADRSKIVFSPGSMRCWGDLTLGRICRYAGSEPNDEVRCVIGARGLRERAEQNALECGTWDGFAEVDLSAETVGPPLRRARLLSLSVETTNLSATTVDFCSPLLRLNRPVFASMRRLTKPFECGRLPNGSSRTPLVPWLRANCE